MRNWQKMTMEFQWEDQERKPQGSNSQTIQSTSLEAISKEVRQGSSIFVIYLQSLDKVARPKMKSDMQKALEAYANIFKEPTQLPLVREVDHCIPLKDGIEPVNVRPYKYAHFQKAKIEKHVQDMLKLGLIKPSTSPLSSLVLLVKKKYETWRFCIDYRALNVVTIKDRFLIPTIDDMLDELYGATYFTKLDLGARYH